jgi:hypothetical protein
MTKTIGSVPVKSRVPLAAWAFAGLLALLSTVSSLVQLAANSHRGELSATASEPARQAQHASVNW